MTELSDIEIKYLKALKAPDYAAFRKYHVEDPAAGTFSWFLEEESLCRWLSEEASSILWIRGSPGQGKTVLSKFLLDRLESPGLVSGHNAKIVYFFFYYQDERLRTVSAALRSLIKQLLPSTDLFKHLFETFDVNSPTDSEDTLWEIFEAMVQDPIVGKVYCILDALDECDEGSRNWLLRRLTRLIQTSVQNRKKDVLKLLVTSRPVLDIIRALDRFPRFDLTANPNDLRLFVHSKVAALQDLSVDLQKRVAELLLDGAGRTFLWVSIVCNQLREVALPLVQMA